MAFDILDPESGQSVARIVTNEDGFATTADLREDGQAGALPFGTYLVREDPSTTPAGYEPVAEFRATVAEDERTYAFTVEDETGTVVRIVKKDAETGRRVNGRMTFRILDERKQPLAFQVGAGGPIVSEFATDEEGVCTLPDKLNGGGTYYVQETCPPPGYVLNDEPAAFSLADRDEEGIVEVVVEDLPQTGRIEVRKVDADTGASIAQPGIVWEVRAAQDVVTADGTVRAQAGETVALLESDDDGTAVPRAFIWAPTRSSRRARPTATCAPASPHPFASPTATPRPEASPSPSTLPTARRRASSRSARPTPSAKGPSPNAAYEVRAAQDIVAPDGTTALVAGEVAATLVTDEEGFACSAPLPLGSYEVVETKAPEGYLVDAEAHPVELVYEGQDVPVVRASLALVDEPVPRPRAHRRNRRLRPRAPRGHPARRPVPRDNGMRRTPRTSKALPKARIGGEGVKRRESEKAPPFRTAPAFRRPDAAGSSAICRKHVNQLPQACRPAAADPSASCRGPANRSP